MATWFIRPDAGNDANAGTSFATAVKTPAAAALSAVAAGETVKWEKSPDPTSIGSATWTDNTATITLAGALTANIERCESAWTAATNVTATAVTTQAREGTNCANIVLAGAFTTGKAAHISFTTIDLSSYQQVSFWIKSTVALAANDVQLDLCSDTSGNTVVNQISVPAVPAALAAQWRCVVVDTAAALGSSIQSIRLFVNVDAGGASAWTINLDNILACKASSSADAITLRSQIGKNTAAEPLWYGVRYINGTTVGIENFSGSTTNRNVWTVSESVTTYKREQWVIAPPATVSTALYSPQSSGSNAAPITFSGGLDPADSMATQNGHSFFTTDSGHGIFWNANGKDYINVEKIGTHRVGRFYSSQGGNRSSPTSFTNCYITGSNNSPGGFESAATGFRLPVLNLINVYAWAVAGDLVNNNYAGYVEFRDCYLSACGTVITNGASEARFYNCKLRRNLICFTPNGGNVFVFGGSIIGSVTAMVSAQLGGDTYITDSEISESTLYTNQVHTNSSLLITNYNNTAGDHRLATQHGTGITDTGTVRTAGIPSWRLNPTSNDANSTRPLRWKIAANILCRANQLMTITCYMRRSNVAITPSLVLVGSETPGVANDVSVSCTEVANTWQLRTISFTPTATGMLGSLYFTAYGGTTHSAYITEIRVS